MNGKTVLITGATSGIGQETAIGLAKLGAHVIVTGRDRQRGEAGVAAIRQASGSRKVDLLVADLAAQAEIHRLADEVMARYARLDVLVNNVGGLYGERWLTVDGIEATLAVNHLTPFLLTQRLLPLLRTSAPARVINVNGGMSIAIELDNLQAEKSYMGLATYSRAKAVMVAASYELALRLGGTGVTLNVAYPGAAATNMTRAMTPNMMPAIMRVLWPVFSRLMGNAKPARAARSSIYLAATAEVEGMNGGNFSANSQQIAWPKQALDTGLRQQLWDISEQLTGISVAGYIPASH